jgi:large subunit ribosomal protein L32e
MVKKFIRRTWKKYSKLGRRRKKLQKWRRPTGRDNKMREKRKGRPPIVSVGFAKDKKVRGLIEGKKQVIINNEKGLEKIGKNEIVILGKIGKKKKIQIVEKAKEKKIKIYNVNIKKFLDKNKPKTMEKKK